MDKRKILEGIISNHLTLKDASIKYDCSVSTLRKYIAGLSKSINEEDIDLYERYLIIARENSIIGRINGGKTGKRASTLSKNGIKNLYNMVLEHDYTLRQLSQITGISKSNLYDLFMKNLDGTEIIVLKDIFDKHHRNALNDYNNDIENSFDFHDVGSLISKHGTRK